MLNFHVESVSNNGFQVSCERKRKRDGWWPFRGKFKTANEKAFCMKGTSLSLLAYLATFGKNGSCTLSIRERT